MVESTGGGRCLARRSCPTPTCCGSCSSYESNPKARRTFAVDAATGRLVWRFPDGEYSPVIGDRERLYLTGFTSLYGLAPAG